jgi:lipopolysaccharide transport system permease protein
LRELVERRELLWFLVWRDLLVRYKQAVLGVLWALLQPLASMAIFAVVFGRLAKLPSDGLPYAAFVLCGLVLWAFFSNALTAAAGSLTGSAPLITKVWFPRLLVPVAAVLAAGPDLAISLPVLAIVLAATGAWAGTAPSAFAGLFALPLLLALLATLAIGAGAGLAALNVRYRDVRHALPFLVQLWMFATPIVWPLSLATPAIRRAAILNPLCGIVEGSRAALTGRPLPWDAIGVSAAVTLLVALAGVGYFQRVERSLADEI